MSGDENLIKSTSFNHVWEELYFCTEFEGGIRCLICLKRLKKVTKFNIRRHYLIFHAEEYEDLRNEKRIEEITRLKADPPVSFTKLQSYFNPVWEELFFFVAYGSQATCLICLKTLNNYKKYNFQRHYSRYHEKEYGALEKELRLAELKKLRERYLATTVNAEESEDELLEEQMSETNKDNEVEFPTPVENISSLPFRCHPTWETYFFVEFKGSPKCLICLKTLTSSKQFNMKRHYYSLHEKEYSVFSVEERISEIKSLKVKFIVTELNVDPSQMDSEEDKTVGDLKKETLNQKVINKLNDSVEEVLQNKGVIDEKQPSDEIDLSVQTENCFPASLTCHPKWESYFFIEFNGIAKCLICLKSLTVRKKYNMQRHYSNLHEKEYSMFNQEERTRKINHLKASFFKTELSCDPCKLLNEQNGNIAGKEIIPNGKDRDRQKFNSKWEYMYFFVECNHMAKCLICLKTLSVIRKFNLERHYVRMHHKEYGMLSGVERRTTIETLKKKVFRPTKAEEEEEEEENIVSHLQSTHSMDDDKPDMDQLVCEVKSEPMSMKLEPEDCGVSEIKYSCNLDCSDLKEEIECGPDTVDSSIPECQANEEVMKLPVSSYENTSSVDENSQTHKEDCKFICKHCNKSYPTKKQLTSHSQIHVELSCDICNKRLPSVLSLKRHKWMHLKDTRRLTCQKCKQLFPDALSLQSHMAIHIYDRPYSCDVCGQKFVRSTFLKKHLLIHAKNAPYCCNICKKTFVNKHDFLDHKNRHTGNRSYLCEICGKGFYSQRELVKHLRIHSGDRRYICDICNKSFNGKSDIVGHMRIHTGLRPYACEVCNRTFSRKDNLKMHRFLHQKVLPYVCIFCNKGFPQARTLKKHLLLH